MAESLWTGVAEAYARSFAGLCAGAVPTLLEGLPAGRLLDVGCGTGELAATARSAGHEVVAVEPDAEMAALATTRLGGVVGGVVSGVVGGVVSGGLPDLPLADDGFDAVLASFVLNHVDDPRAGARELARVGAPGGVVRATIWGSVPPPQTAMWNALLDQAGAVRPVLPRLPEEKDFPRTPDGLAGILTEAGLAVTSAGTASWRWRVGRDDLWAGLTEVGNNGVVWRAQDEDVRARVRAAYDMLDEDLSFDVECVRVEAAVPRA